jgi:phosphocarrier protein FPr/phosphocarrier protein
VTTQPEPAAIVLAAPLGGWLMPLDEVNDPVFAGRVLGDGVAIDPVESPLRAPFDGVVTSVHRARHAVTVRADCGAEALMHIGVDTVALKGEGFEVLVQQGARVMAGDPLIGFDVDLLAQLARSLVIPIILTNGDAFTLRRLDADREVKAGEPILAIAARAEAAQAPAAAPSGEIVTLSATLADPHGLHARPAGLLGAVAKETGAQITLLLGDRSANVASPVALMLLGAQQGHTLAIEASGPNARAAAERVAALLSSPDPMAAAGQSAPSATHAAPLAAPQVKDAPDAPTTPLAPGEALEIDGVTGAPGLAAGHSRRFVVEALTFEEAGRGVETETAALRAARRQTAESIEAAIERSGAGQQADILRAHLAFLRDPDLSTTAAALIREGKSGAYAWKTTIDRQVAALRKLGNPVLAERAADLEDVCRRVLLILLGRKDDGLALAPDTILFADDLPPSQFADLDVSKLAGLCLASGGPTSHIAILAGSKGIPTVVAAGAGALRVPDGQPVVIDAEAGRVRVNPPAADFEATRAAALRRRERAAANRAATQADCYTADGVRVEVMANLGGPADVAVAVENGAEGCGLLRSEFIFLNRTAAPTEDEQLAQYQAVATGLQGRPLIIRTLDAGADKDVPYANLPKEENPALGLRGVRTSLWRPELLRAQARAILRVEPFGQVRMMLPMIATVQDLRDVRAIVAEEAASLGRTQPISIGIMVEVPSAALIAERLAVEADFFSVGTNDLTQYTLAMDRVNARLARQLDSFHPAVLRLIALAAEGAGAHGRWIGVCGSLASFPIAAPLLIGLGVRELSVTAAVVAEVKAIVRTLKIEDCVAVARQALTLESGAEVRRLLARHWPDV